MTESGEQNNERTIRINPERIRDENVFLSDCHTDVALEYSPRQPRTLDTIDSISSVIQRVNRQSADSLNIGKRVCRIFRYDIVMSSLQTQVLEHTCAPDAAATNAMEQLPGGEARRPTV